MISETVVELSQWQFAITASYHFLFMPLTVGLSFILAIMESAYVFTGRETYKDMTRFWGKFFGINFVMGMATGLVMAFQLGMNGSFFSHYAGDVLGAPLVITGLLVFFLESTLIGWFFLGWDKLTSREHLIITWLVAFGSNFSVLFILIANGWMQNPIGAEFNYETMRMELNSFTEVIFNPVTQVKFVHTLAASYTTAASFVLAISAYFLLKGRDIAFSQRSYAIAAGFGLASVLSVIILGQESSHTARGIQKTKFAAINAEWFTEKSPAAFTLSGFPNQKLMVTHDAVQIPWLLGLIGTRSVNTPVIGLSEIMGHNRGRIYNGIKAYGLLQQLHEGESNKSLINNFESVKKDLGYGLLLKRYTENVVDATEQDIELAIKDSVPNVTYIFWAFRVMLACGLIMLLIFIIAATSVFFRKTQQSWILLLSLYTLPLPWIASESGWIVSELGRQPWIIADNLPTFMGVSSVIEWDLIISLAGTVFFYTLFLIIAIFLMLKTINSGPSCLYKQSYPFKANKGSNNDF